MEYFKNSDGQIIVEEMIKAIQENKDYLSKVDGLIGDGDHGTNMNKGFSMTQAALKGKKLTFTESLALLGDILFNEIGGSMGPIYGTLFTEMADAAQGVDQITLKVFTQMLAAGLDGLQDIVEARVGDKTLIDTLTPALATLKAAQASRLGFEKALCGMKAAAAAGKDSTRDLVAKFGRSSRLGERSRGVLDAGAVSCNIILGCMADQIIDLLKRESMKKKIRNILEHA